MAQQTKRNFVGSGKKVGNYDLINVSICLSGLPTDAIHEYKGKQYLNITIGGKRDGADKYGKTHSVWLNEFKPDKGHNGDAENRQPSTPSDTEVGYPEEISPEDIPW